MEENLNSIFMFYHVIYSACLMSPII